MSVPVVTVLLSVLVVPTLVAVATDSCLQLLIGHVEAGNYTYYRLAHEGDVELSLWSIHGDADIYVSQRNLQPTYELDTYDLQSVTCGEDKVEIPSTFKRPVGIGIYGHPSYSSSSYQLCVNFASSDYQERNSVYDYHQNSFSDSDDIYSNYDTSGPAKHQPRVPGFPGGKDDEQESLLWTVLIGLLRVIVDVFI